MNDIMPVLHSCFGCSGCQIHVLASIEGNHPKMAGNVVTFKIGEAYKSRSS